MTMSEKPKHAWMVRAGNDNQLAPLVEEKHAVAIGWWEMGDMTGLKTREEFRTRYIQSFPDYSISRVNVNTGQVYRFAREILIGDYGLTYDKASRELLIGIVRSDMEYRPELFNKTNPNIRRVDWLKRISRDLFSPAARNSLGSPLTVFQIDEHLAELNRLVTGEIPTPAVVEAEENEQVPFHEDIKSKADEKIADLITKLDPYEFQDLVAALLRAMGFRATSSPPGRDKGVDVIAYPDALGFGKPRIKVQVKHRAAPTGGPDVRNLVGALSEQDNGLFVSTGGFSNDALAEEARARSPITLIDRDRFIELLKEHYEKLEPEYQAQVPLMKLWVPTR